MKCIFEISLEGDTFQEINSIIEDETERLKTILIMYSRMADVYTDVFKCNPNIVMISRKTFGNIIIDDNNVQIVWLVHGHEIMFDFEEYWGSIELSIDAEEAVKTIAEITKAFEAYYGKMLYNEVTEEIRGTETCYKLSLSDKHT